MSVHSRIRLLFQENGPNLILTKLMVIFLINALGAVLGNYTEMYFSISLHRAAILQCDNYSNIILLQNE